MNGLTNYRKFVFNGSYHRDKEDFSYYVFTDYDFSTEKQYTTFFRSDFRGSRFDSIKFYKNNFDRADFVSCSFINTTFFQVDIAACEMKNCYYENVTFRNNNYNNTSIQECIFKDCTFEDENLLINMKNCKFFNCQFSNVKFERSTTESIIFKSCQISNTDFANMHAERYKFVSCTLNNVLIDVCYIFGYLFFDTNLLDFNIIYMGETIDFTEDNLLFKFASSLWGRYRYYEHINAYIMFGHLDKVEPLIKKAFTELINISTPQRNLEIYNLFDMLQFYISNNAFDFNSVKSFLNFFENFNISLFSFDEKITYMSQLEKIKTYLSDAQYDYDFILSAKNDVSFVTFYCSSNNYSQAFNTVSKILDEIYNSLGLAKQYTLIDAQKGSWILTFVVISASALLLPKFLKKSADLYFELDTKRKISKRISDKLQKERLSTSELKQLTEIAVSSGLVASEIKEVDLSDINKIIEMIKIGI